MDSRKSLSVLLTTLLVFVGCGSDTPLSPKTPDQVTFAPSLGVNLAGMQLLASGVYIETRIGGEEPQLQEGDIAILSYKGWLPNGTQFDAGTGYSYTVGVSPVIAGFSQGVRTMQLGETRLIVIPSALGYGAASPSGIPPHSVLVFEVELTAINP